MESPKISVIIPTYNRAGLIVRSIRSILKQTYKNYEIIVIDDASTDNTEDVVKSFNCEKIFYYRLSKNSGQCVSRNKAIMMARGEYIGFLDSDDEWLPTKLEKQLKLFERSKDPDLAAVYCGFIERDEVLNRTVIINRRMERGNLYHRLLQGYCPSTPTQFLVKKEALLRVNGFDEKLPTFVDYDLWLRIAQLNYTFDLVEEPLIIKYEHNGDQIAKDPAKRSKGLEIFLRKWGDEIIRVSGKKHFYSFRKRKIESLAMSIINNPGIDYKNNIKNSLGLLGQVKSFKFRLYAKALYVLMTGKKHVSVVN